MREKLIELLQDDDCPLLYVLGENVGTLADYLIANGVTVKVEKPPTDLSGKCGSCAFARVEPKKYGYVDSLVRCTNPEHLAKYCRGIDISLRQRTTKACKQYKQKNEE